MTDLVRRCAAFHWRLEHDGDEWLLLGNGAPARFQSEASLVDWLTHQEKAAKRPVESEEQMMMELAA